MALIKCPECGRNVSDTANACPNCGFAISGIENIQELSRIKEEELGDIKREKSKTAVICAIIAIIFAITCYAGYYKSTELERSRARTESLKDELNEINKKMNDTQRQIDRNKAIIEYNKNND